MKQQKNTVAIPYEGPRRKDVFRLLACAIAGWMLISCHNDTPDTVERAKETNAASMAVSESDMKFAVEAASGGMMEVEMGRMALNQASSQDVKDFAQMMIDDHSAANAELQELARNKSITLPAAPGEEQQEKINKLAPKKGADFDRAYVDMMVSDHESDVAAFENESRNGADADLKNWAATKLPVLRHHLDMAKEASARKR